MTLFAIHFLICNGFIALFVCAILAFRYIFRSWLSSQRQYQLWFLFLFLLIIPFLPIRINGFSDFFVWLKQLKTILISPAGTTRPATVTATTDPTFHQIHDFTISVSKKMPGFWIILLLSVWIVGIFVMLFFMIRSRLQLYHIEKSALPLQSQNLLSLYEQCRQELHLKRNIPLYSTAFLTSPVIVGLRHPRIYMPLHLISDFHAKDMRYMLLHELQHYKRKDALANHLMNFAGMIYWFHPFVWHALKEMRNDRELACDASVLRVLNPEEYTDYGNTLINFAEKISMLPFPFASGIGGSIRQIRQRIINIANYQPESPAEKVRGLLIYLTLAILLAGFAPVLSTYAGSQENYTFNHAKAAVSYIDLSSYFDGYEGSFVLYDSSEKNWQIYNKDLATRRVSPDSTYKIYDALFALESNIITPEQSQMAWDGEIWPFDAWNADQDLNSAMQNSVNWYFQNLDQENGPSAIKKYLQAVSYGNEDISGAFNSYWMESSLKISPVEQVELLTKFYNNEFSFDPENMKAVKKALLLSESENGTVYGKTGTGQVNGQDINGWFVGFIEKGSDTCFFAVNIQNAGNATGSAAAEIALSILEDMQNQDLYPSRY